MSINLTEIPLGLPGQIYRSPMPYSKFDNAQDLFSLYKKSGITTVVVLISDEESLEKSGRDLNRIYRDNGYRIIHMPIPDFSIPNIEQFRQAVQMTIERLQAKERVAVHCHAGIGRSGLFLSCLAKQVKGISGEQAIAWVRRYIKGAVEVPEQIAMVESF